MTRSYEMGYLERQAGKAMIPSVRRLEGGAGWRRGWERARAGAGAERLSLRAEHGLTLEGHCGRAALKKDQISHMNLNSHSKFIILSGSITHYLFPFVLLTNYYTKISWKGKLTPWERQLLCESPRQVTWEPRLSLGLYYITSTSLPCLHPSDL